jgi:hypothetical protein
VLLLPGLHFFLGRLPLDAEEVVDERGDRGVDGGGGRRSGSAFFSPFLPLFFLCVEGRKGRRRRGHEGVLSVTFFFAF